ncbi:MAG TPA: ATP-binding protein [Chitinophagaceae bacterium]
MPLESAINETAALLHSLIAARDKARDELGVELQDNICQLLASAQLLIELAREEAAGAGGVLNKGLLHLNMAMKEIRKIAQSFNGAVVQDLGLEAAIDSWLESAPSPMKTYLDFDEELERALSPTLKLMIYRVVQEHTENIYHHAHAGGLSIELRRKDQQLCFTISDDGKGFNTKQPHKGMGLAIIQNRVASFQGSFSVQSAPGKGCQLLIHLPLPVASLRQSFTHLAPENDL